MIDIPISVLGWVESNTCTSDDGRGEVRAVAEKVPEKNNEKQSMHRGAQDRIDSDDERIDSPKRRIDSGVELKFEQASRELE